VFILQMYENIYRMECHKTSDEISSELVTYISGFTSMQGQQFTTPGNVQKAIYSCAHWKHALMDVHPRILFSNGFQLSDAEPGKLQTVWMPTREVNGKQRGLCYHFNKHGIPTLNRDKVPPHPDLVEMAASYNTPENWRLMESRRPTAALMIQHNILFPMDKMRHIAAVAFPQYVVSFSEVSLSDNASAARSASAFGACSASAAGCASPKASPIADDDDAASESEPTAEPETVVQQMCRASFAVLQRLDQEREERARPRMSDSERHIHNWQDWKIRKVQKRMELGKLDAETGAREIAQLEVDRIHKVGNYKLGIRQQEENLAKQHEGLMSAELKASLRKRGYTFYLPQTLARVEKEAKVAAAERAASEHRASQADIARVSKQLDEEAKLKSNNDAMAKFWKRTVKQPIVPYEDEFTAADEAARLEESEERRAKATARVEKSQKRGRGD
jgi:hypothetical protein